MKKVIVSLATLIVIMLTGCGGGGASSSSSDTSGKVSAKTDASTQSTIALALPDVPQIPAGN